MPGSIMRGVHAIFSVLLIGFAAVQYNDPDYYLWMPVYGLPALIAAWAAWSPAVLSARWMRCLIGVGVLLCAPATLFLWPSEAQFWTRAVWEHSETAREGMGMMIVTAILAALATDAWRRKPPGDA